VTAGEKAYVFQAKLNGRVVRVTIGRVGAGTLAAARAKANKLQAMIDEGIDPRQEKRDRLAAVEAKRVEAETKRVESERVAAPALEAWQQYIDARRGKWSARHLLEHERVIAEGGEPRAQGRRPGESDKTMPGILRPLLVAAPLPELVQRSPRVPQPSTAGACITRMARDELPKNTAKDDCLQREQLPAWFVAVRQIGNLSAPICRLHCRLARVVKR
jgi:hypothetical protein